MAAKTSKTALVKHKNLHGEPKFKCKECNKVFVQGTDLRRHEAIHEKGKTKPFQCSHCKIGFTLKHNLLKHQRKVYGQKSLNT